MQVIPCHCFLKNFNNKQSIVRFYIICSHFLSRKTCHFVIIDLSVELCTLCPSPNSTVSWIRMGTRTTLFTTLYSVSGKAPETNFIIERKGFGSRWERWTKAWGARGCLAIPHLASSTENSAIPLINVLTKQAGLNPFMELFYSMP